MPSNIFTVHESFIECMKLSTVRKPIIKIIRAQIKFTAYFSDLEIKDFSFIELLLI